MKRAVAGIAFCVLLLAGLFANYAQEPKPTLAKPAQDETTDDEPKHESEDKAEHDTDESKDGYSTYCPQFFEWQMNSGGTTYYWYRVQLCDPGKQDDCQYSDLETTTQLTCGGFCADCGGGCATQPMRLAKGFGSRRSEGDLPIIPNVKNWTRVSWDWKATNADQDPQAKNHFPTSAYQEYHVVVSIDNKTYMFRCVEVMIPCTKDALRVGVEIDPTANKPVPDPKDNPTVKTLDKTMTMYVGPEENSDQYHHKVIAVDDGKVKVFHVAWVSAPPSP